MIEKKRFQNYLLLFVILFFLFSYFSKLYFQLGHIDEVNYLSDSLLLFEGILPASKHAPSGLTTWIGTIYLGLDYLFNLFFLEKLDIFGVMENFDFVIYKNYKDLTNIKLTLIIFNSLLLLYFILRDNEKSLLLLFLFVYTSFFAALALLIKEQNRRLAFIFFGLALAEKWEFIVLISYFFFNQDKKIDPVLYFLPFLIFFAVAPWFLISVIQNSKIQFNFFLQSNNFSGSFIEDYSNILSLIIYIFMLLFIPIIKNIRIKIISLVLVLLIIIFLVNIQGFYIRWFLPFFLMICFECSKNKFTKNYFFQLGILALITINLIHFNLSKFTSDLEILKKEENSNYENILSTGLLKEELNFNKYVDIQHPYINKKNIKNINFFNNQNAPLAFSEAGNLEKLYLRRYEYLIRYDKNNKKKNKFIRYGTGLNSDEVYWCNKLKKENLLILYKNDSKNCNEIN
jgi:hypothetical protein